MDPGWNHGKQAPGEFFFSTLSKREHRAPLTQSDHVNFP